MALKCMYEAKVNATIHPRMGSGGGPEITEIISFTLMTDEKNPRAKETVKKRFFEYLQRAELLKEAIRKQGEEKEKKPMRANGGDRSPTKK